MTKEEFYRALQYEQYDPYDTGSTVWGKVGGSRSGSFKGGMDEETARGLDDRYTELTTAKDARGRLRYGTDLSGITPDGGGFAPVVINGERWIRGGFGWDEASSGGDPTFHKFVQQYGVKPEDFKYTPEHGDLIRESVYTPLVTSYAATQKGGLTDMLTAMPKILGSAMMGMALGGALPFIDAAGNFITTGTGLLPQLGIDTSSILDKLMPSDTPHGVNPGGPPFSGAEAAGEVSGVNPFEGAVAEGAASGSGSGVLDILKPVGTVGSAGASLAGAGGDGEDDAASAFEGAMSDAVGSDNGTGGPANLPVPDFDGATSDGDVSNVDDPFDGSVSDGSSDDPFDGATGDGDVSGGDNPFDGSVGDGSGSTDFSPAQLSSLAKLLGVPLSTIAGLLGSVASGAYGANQAQKAAEAQERAAAAAIAEQRRQYDLTRSDNAPFLATGTAANARLKQLLGIDSTYTGADSGSLTRKFTAEDMNADPVYQSGLQFGLDEGRKGVNARAIGGGMYDSGSTLKALTRYGNDYASTKGNDAFNRFTTENTNAYNKYAGVSGAGQNAVNTVSTAGTNAANNISDQLTGAGNARAAGIVGGINAWGSAAQGVNSALSNYNSNAILERLLSSRGY